MSLRYCDVDDSRSIISAMSQAYSCPPVPLRRRARMKKAAAPLPPSKVTTPLNQSLTNLQLTKDGPGPRRGPSSVPLPVSGLPLPPSLLRDQGDECAINELLEGRMDLDVVLPDARKVRMNVERRTPMMDLLVQVTTAHKVNPGGHVIHIPTDRGRDYLQYKPNTPIGSLDTNSIHIVPKSAVFDPPVKKMPKVANKPFQETFRLQVNLPRNQLMVMRVGHRTTLAEVKIQACREKNLDPSRYTLAHPQRQDAILDLNSTMSSYGATEITLISNSNFNANMCNSTSDLIAYATREDNQKKKSILGLFTRKKSKASIVDSSSDSLDSRGVSPSRSDGSGPRNSSAKVSVKKRPAPPPPPKLLNQKIETNNKTVCNVTTTTAAIPIATLLPPREKQTGKTDGSNVSHSRHSSDSSGYHEASLLSESPENRSPDVCSGSGSSGLSVESSTHPVTNTRRKSSTPPKPTQDKIRPMLTSLSDTQLLANNRKRRAPPPPPVPPKSEVVCDVQKSLSKEVVMEEVIVEDPITEKLEEQEQDVGPESKTPSPDPASSSLPVSEAESDLVEDVVRSLPILPSTASPASQDSPPAFPHTDSGLNVDDTPEDTEDVDLAFSHDKERKTSVTSLGSIADIQNAFDLTIAEAEKVLEEEDKRLNVSDDQCLEEHNNKDKAEVTVSQHQIPSGMKAAFVAVAEGPKQESEGPRSPIKDADSRWDYAIAEPPPAFRNDEKFDSSGNCNFSVSTGHKNQVLSVQQMLPSPVKVSPVKEISRKEAVKKTVDSGLSEITVINPPAPILLKVETPEVKEPLINASRDSLVLKSSLSLNTRSAVKEKPSTYNVKVIDTTDAVEKQPLKYRRPPLLNFRIETYKQPKEDIFNHFDPAKVKPVIKSAPVISSEVHSIPVTGSASSLDLLSTPIKPPPPPPASTLMYGIEGSVRGVKGKVQQRRTEMTDASGSALVARSASMLNLTPTTRATEVGGSIKPIQRTTSNVLDSLRKAQSVQDLKSDENDSVEDLEQEQERLQEEYSKLHQQFLVWNQQLQDNQNLLEKQKIVSVSTLLPLPIKEPDKVSRNIPPCSNVTVVDDVALRSQTLPRSKAIPVIQHPVEEKRTFTLDRRPKSQILSNVSIGSWQQRRSSENLSVLSTTEKSQPHRTEYSSSVVSENKPNGLLHSSGKPSVSIRPVSMYASWQKPQTVEVDKQKPKFNVQFNNSQSGQLNSLRTSSTKTYFKPPEIRTSSASRQRIPPENINGPPEEFISTTVNCKKQSVYEPKEISGKTVSYLNTDKERSDPNVRSSQTNDNAYMSNGLKQRPSFLLKTAPRVVGFRINGVSEPTANIRVAGPPDPPPLVVSTTTPPSTLLVSHVPSKELPSLRGNSIQRDPSSRNAKSTHLLKVNPLDPREELMLEIRNFGGKKTLRKLPEDQTSWELKVHGSNSIITS